MRLAAWIVTAVIMVAAFWLQLANGLNADVSWLLTVGERMLDGQALYTDILELNPPMSALLYLPMVALGRWLGLAPEPLVVAAILLLTIAALWASLAILRREGLLPKRDRWWIIAIAALTVLPGDNFGEREHIAVVLLLPLLTVAALRQTGRTPSRMIDIAAGIAAGLAMTIKPHFALPILLVALAGAAAARSWRPVFNVGHVAAGLVLIAYWIGVWFWFPAFFEDMLPLASIAYMGDRMAWSFLLFGLPTLPFWLMLAGLMLVYRREAVAPVNLQMLVAAVGFFLAYLVQGKGFIYHLLPVYIFLTIVFALSFIALNGQGRRGPVFIAVALVIVAYPSLTLIRGDDIRNQALAALRQMGPGLTMANLSSHLGVTSPLHRQLEARLVNAGPCLWVTLGARRRMATSDDADLIAQMLELERMERDRLYADLHNAPPDVILTGADQFDWLAWARQDEDFAALLDGYEVMATIGPEDAKLRILRRQAT